MMTTTEGIVFGLRPEFLAPNRKLFVDESVLPIDAPDEFAAGSMKSPNGLEHIHWTIYSEPTATWRGRHD